MTSQAQVRRLLSLVPYLREHDGVAMADVAAAFGINLKTLREDLSVLWMCGLPGLAPGDLIHFYAHLSFPMTEHLPVTVRPGSTVELTREMIELSRDRHGWSWLSLVDDPGEQQRRYGRLRFARGPAPDGLLPERHSPDWDISREEAHAAARAIQHPGKRQEAISKATATFGPSGPQSQTQAVYAQFR